MKKILVTGGSGFIGSNLILLLLKKKYAVINIDKSAYSANPYNVERFKKIKIIIFLNWILMKEIRLLKLLKNINHRNNKFSS